jgi:hypothetical protein
MHCFKNLCGRPADELITPSTDGHIALASPIVPRVSA